MSAGNSRAAPGIPSLFFFLMSLLLSSPLLSATALPGFYTPVSSLHEKLSSVTKACGKAAKIEEVEGLPVVTIHTGAGDGAENPRSVRSLLLYGEHARELVSPELAFRLMQDLCHAIGGDSAPRFSSASMGAGSGTLQNAYSSTLTELARQRALTLKIVPVANLWGRKQVEGGDFCRRTNEHGVDLNRNYDAHWAPPAAETSPDSYPGTSPFSEVETQAIRSIMTEFRPHIFLSVHSGTVGMYLPPAYTLQGPQPNSESGKREFSMMRLLQKISDETKAVAPVPVGPAASKVGYLCPGTCLDYAFENVQTPYAYAFEVYDASSSAGAHPLRAMPPRFAEKTEIQHEVVTSCFAHNPPSGFESSGGPSLNLLEIGGGRRLRRNRAFDRYFWDRYRFSQVQDQKQVLSVSSSGALSTLMTSEQCLQFFNPLEPTVFETTMELWSLRTVRLLQLSHEQVVQDHLASGQFY